MNRPTSAVTGALTTTYTNDAYGRRTSRSTGPAGPARYSWDPLGHLVTVVGSKEASFDTTCTFEYGISGMREQVTVQSGGVTTTRKSVWDGQTLVAEQDSDGTVYRYLWGPERTPLALEVVSPSGTSSFYDYRTDAAGSVVAITSGTSADPVATYTYDAFGSVVATGGSDAALAKRNPLRYRAYYYDTATSLYYLAARYYEPEGARFLSPDPAPPSAGDPLSLNAYAYCQGDPVNASDPTGAVKDAGGGSGSSDDYYESLESGAAAWWYSTHGWSLDEAKGIVQRQRQQASYLKWRAARDARRADYQAACRSDEGTADSVPRFYVRDAAEASDTLFNCVGSTTAQGAVFAIGGVMAIGAGLWLFAGGTIAMPFTCGGSLAGVGAGIALLSVGAAMVPAGWCLIDAGDRDSDMTDKLLGR